LRRRVLVLAGVGIAGIEEVEETEETEEAEKIVPGKQRVDFG